MNEVGELCEFKQTHLGQVTGDFFFGGVNGLKWRKPVVPGDTLMMRVEVKKFNKRFGVCKMDAKAYVGADLVCEAELTLVMAK
jgi:3-hydroxyacyl-[acyl-carrier-protein] dehydratase